MTRKDYKAIARMIDENSTVANLRGGITHVIKSGNFVNELCEYLQEDNSKFNEVKFREATGEIVNQEQ